MLLVFLHIPKTAGSTLASILCRHYPPSRTLDVYGELDDHIAALKEYPAADKKALELILGHLPFGIHREPGFPDEVRYITCLRDPIERFLSDYGYIKTTAGHPKARAVARRVGKAQAEDISLDDYIGYLGEINGWNEQTRIICGGYPPKIYGPPKDRLSPPSLDSAKAIIERHFAVVGLTERFDETMVLLRRALGWSEANYSPLNVTKSRPRSAQLPDSVIAKIKCENQMDIELYDCAGRLMDRQIERYGPSFQRDLRRYRWDNWRHTQATQATQAMGFAYRNFLKLPRPLQTAIRTVAGRRKKAPDRHGGPLTS